MCYTETDFQIFLSIKKDVAALLLKAIEKAAQNGFDITDCHIDVHFTNDPITHWSNGKAGGLEFSRIS
ncbi:hypothetical protein PSI23_18670 [Xenorhabdus sp. XENO-10]|uniref:Uncharacterized protein n=1 Tax=Xenorhabdus yunnanensis TaxID=3025878 RepID=A0ABT5LN87_9GAMM|nr:hypothetical protein [Xenorhabdus yunnanensis]MDC9591255.1 hypothetical protein [Xenorhabdus yunnanensis]